MKVLMICCVLLFIINMTAAADCTGYEDTSEGLTQAGGHTGEKRQSTFVVSGCSGCGGCGSDVTVQKACDVQMQRQVRRIGPRTEQRIITKTHYWLGIFKYTTRMVQWGCSKNWHQSATLEDILDAVVKYCCDGSVLVDGDTCVKEGSPLLTNMNGVATHGPHCDAQNSTCTMPYGQADFFSNAVGLDAMMMVDNSQLTTQ